MDVVEDHGAVAVVFLLRYCEHRCEDQLYLLVCHLPVGLKPSSGFLPFFDLIESGRVFVCLDDDQGAAHANFTAACLETGDFAAALG